MAKALFEAQVSLLAGRLRLDAVSAATFAGGHLDQLPGPPTGPQLFRNAAERADKRPYLSLKPSPDSGSTGFPS